MVELRKREPSGQTHYMGQCEGDESLLPTLNNPARTETVPTEKEKK